MYVQDFLKKTDLNYPYDPASGRTLLAMVELQINFSTLTLTITS